MTAAMPYGWGKVPFAYEDRLRWRIMPFAAAGDGPVGLVGSWPDVLISAVGLPADRVRRGDALLVELRKIKSPAEVEVLRKACFLADDAAVAAMGAVRPGATEFELAAAA